MHSRYWAVQHWSCRAYFPECREKEGGSVDFLPAERGKRSLQKFAAADVIALDQFNEERSLFGQILIDAK